MNATWETTTRKHGTNSGYTFHQDLGERPCDACYRARQEYDKRRLEAPERTRQNRARASAQQRAYKRLARLYPDIYRALYDEECVARGLTVRARAS